MREKLFLIISSCFLLLNGSSVALANRGDGELSYVTMEAVWEKYIFNGDPENMPLNSDYLIAIDYEKLPTDMTISSFDEALNAISTLLPKWYQAALRQRYIDKGQCEVVVNEENYSEYVINWLDEYIFTVQRSRDLRQKIKDMGYVWVGDAYRFYAVSDTLHYKYCLQLGEPEEKAEALFINKLKEWEHFLSTLVDNLRTKD